MGRRTKIIATVGPSSESEATIKDMVAAGADVLRINLSHGSLEEGLARLERIRSAEAAIERPVGVLVDLPGPKVRTGPMPEGGLPLDDGQELVLRPGHDTASADAIFVDHDNLLSDLHVGDRVSFGDGAVVVEIDDRHADHFAARIIHGARLQGRPGVHIPSDRLRMATPTAEDLRLLDAFIDAGVDMVALSFVRSAHDVRRVGTEPHPRGPMVVAKIETRAAVQNLDGIIEASGAVMVARGDLGAEMALEELPHLQKQILQRCITLGRPAITATQMLESMVQAPTPTRAETSDIANAVFDGTSVVMLSGETAVGRDPVNAVATMARIAERADTEFDHEAWPSRVHKISEQMRRDIDDVVTMGMTDAAWRAASETGATAIICITRTGFTVRSIARFRPTARILGFSTDERTLRQITLSWGATPYQLEGGFNPDTQIAKAVDLARHHGELRTGDLVAVLSGSADYPGQATDSLRLVRV